MNFTMIYADIMASGHTLSIEENGDKYYVSIHKGGFHWKARSSRRVARGSSTLGILRLRVFRGCSTSSGKGTTLGKSVAKW